MIVLKRQSREWKHPAAVEPDAKKKAPATPDAKP